MCVCVSNGGAETQHNSSTSHKTIQFACTHTRTHTEQNEALFACGQNLQDTFLLIVLLIFNDLPTKKNHFQPLVIIVLFRLDHLISIRSFFSCFRSHDPADDDDDNDDNDCMNK